MSERSHKGTTFSTFTAAAQVRRDLTAAGFFLKRFFAYKRNASRLYSQESDQSLLLEDKKKSLKVVVLGAGVAGVTCAYQLKQVGFDNVELLDSEGLAKKASGNPVGIIQPYLTGGFTPGDQLVHQGFSLTKQVVQQNLQVTQNFSGLVQMITKKHLEESLLVSKRRIGLSLLKS